MSMPKTTEQKILYQLQKMISHSMHELRALETEENYIGGVDRHDDRIKEVRERIRELIRIRFDLECAMTGVIKREVIPNGN